MHGELNRLCAVEIKERDLTWKYIYLNTERDDEQKLIDKEIGCQSEWRICLEFDVRISQSSDKQAY